MGAWTLFGRAPPAALAATCATTRGVFPGQPTDPVDGDVARPGVAGAAAEHDGGQHGVEHASGDAER